jgi:tetratricopeptide (TPR) repeat protein
MDVLTAGSIDIFSQTANQGVELESLANQAIKGGIDHYVNKNYEAAAKEFNRAIGLAPRSSYAVDAAHYMAQAHLQLGDTGKATDAYKRAIQLNPYRDDSYIELGNLYIAEEQYEEATELYQEAVRLNPDASNNYFLGQVYLLQERYREAETQFTTVDRMMPEDPAGRYGIGLVYSREGRHEAAVQEFQQALALDDEFYDAHAELGYVYADMGEMDKAQEVVDHLDGVDQADLADSLARYMYKVDPPKIAFAYAESSLPYLLPAKTPVVALDAYLTTPGASKTFTMKFQFDKAMDRESVENIVNWQITRSIGQGPGQAYNYGLGIPDTEVNILPMPISVTYDDENYTATVRFNIKQNDNLDATIDPSHLEFKFSGTDIYGQKMSDKHDQFTGFSRVY